MTKWRWEFALEIGFLAAVVVLDAAVWAMSPAEASMAGKLALTSAILVVTVIILAIIHT